MFFFLATGFDFREKKRVCFGSIGVLVRLQPPTLPLYYEGKVKKTIFPQDFVYVLRDKDQKNSPHGKFHRFLFPFSSKFSDLNFASYVLYNLPVLCHVSRTVSLGYLCLNVLHRSFISESFESKLNSDSCDEEEMILKQTLDVLVPKYIGTIKFSFHFLAQIQRAD